MRDLVKLCEFIGGILSDISQARQLADSNSVLLSQSYHADEFMKGMPVPHYTIDEADISVPVMVVGVQPDSGQYAALERGVQEAIRLKLPGLLYVVFKNHYIDLYRKRKQQEALENQAMMYSSAAQAAMNDQPSIDPGAESVPTQVKQRFSRAVENIAGQFQNPMDHFLKTANFEVVKLLDIKDFFCTLLHNFLLKEFAADGPACIPWGDGRGLDAICREIGTRMFFEFKQVMQNARGVMVEPNTGKMSEYGSKDCIMYVRLKVREQDVDFVVEPGSDGGGKRFISLN